MRFVFYSVSYTCLLQSEIMGLVFYFPQMSFRKKYCFKTMMHFYPGLQTHMSRTTLKKGTQRV